MNIAATQYNVNSQAYELYVAGCEPPHCPNCHNKELHNFNPENSMNIKEIILDFKRKLNKYPELIKNIFIMGGEPLDQDREDLGFLVYKLKEFGIPIWLFTRYDLKQVPVELLSNLAYVKAGEYKEGLPSHVEHGITLASSNQHVFRNGVDY